MVWYVKRKGREKKKLVTWVSARLMSWRMWRGEGNLKTCQAPRWASSHGRDERRTAPGRSPDPRYDTNQPGDNVSFITAEHWKDNSVYNNNNQKKSLLCPSIHLSLIVHVITVAIWRRIEQKKRKQQSRITYKCPLWHVFIACHHVQLSDCVL